MIEDENRRNEPLIRNVFSHEDVETILSMPLRISMHEDLRVSVKCVYKLAFARNIEGEIANGVNGHDKYRELESMKPM